MKTVLDSFAVIAYLENERGADQVAELMKKARDAQDPLLMSVVNWGEVYYTTVRAAGKAAADEAMTKLDTLPIDIVPVDRQLAHAAAEFKAGHKMSYADCFAAALARQRTAAVVPGAREVRP
ncbi:MAG: type II toxin-antitoxin system VapC family toxin, partial [bacterium]